ncbi:MAG TPA: metallophosphoesterase [Rickettsiales bacterium]|nr:metallophosphoesterase [Rickettsiales bacterium]
MTVPKATWLHISDFHFNTNNYDQDVVLNALIKSIKSSLNNHTKIDLIFATGDIAFSGKTQEYDAATRFFDDLLDVTGLNKERLIIVPGNHDVDRVKGMSLIRSLQHGGDADNYFAPENDKLHISVKQKAFVDWYNAYFPNNPFCIDSSCGKQQIVDIEGFRIGILPINTALFSVADDDHGKLWIGRRSVKAALDAILMNRNSKVRS